MDMNIKIALMGIVLTLLSAHAAITKEPSAPSLQIHEILVEHQAKTKAEEILAVVMESNTGKIIGIDSSLSMKPFKTPEQIIESKAYTYLYQPTRTIYAILLGLTEEKELREKVLNKEPDQKSFLDELDETIPLQKKLKDNPDVNDTKILTADDIYRGLYRFGYFQKTGLSMFEKELGSIEHAAPVIDKVPTERARIGMGYGMSMPLIQHVLAYNVYNNNGVWVSPNLDGRKKHADNTYKVFDDENLSKAANEYMKFLSEPYFKDMNNTGLEYGGMPYWNFHYDNLAIYDASFVGFVNDGKSKYTIGILAIKPNLSDNDGMAQIVDIVKEIIKVLKQQQKLEYHDN